MHLERRLRQARHCRVQAHPDLALAYRQYFSGPFLAAAVEYLHRRARCQAQNAPNIVGQIVFQQAFAFSQLGVQIETRYAHALSPV